MVRLNPTYLDFWEFRVDEDLMLDFISEHLLMLVARAHADRRQLNVTDLMQQRDIASPATIHKRLQTLIESGLVSVEPILGEYPKKEVALTKEGIKYTNRLGQLVRKTANGTRAGKKVA